jgi:hypothetical protein
MMWTLWLGCALGLTQGVRHAFEPDHLAAVSTMVAEQRSARASAAYAAFWGAGHALVLLVVAGSLFALRRQMPDELARAFELVVAVVLVALGLRALRAAVRAGRNGPASLHRHRGRAHVHAGVSDHVHVWSWTVARRPLLVGLVHGLAGSGALTALVAAAQPSAPVALAFMALYGTGAMLGMALLASVAGVPLAHAMHTRWGAPVLLGASGAMSFVFGLVWGWPIVHAMVLAR